MFLVKYVMHCKRQYNTLFINVVGNKFSKHKIHAIYKNLFIIHNELTTKDTVVNNFVYEKIEKLNILKITMYISTKSLFPYKS